MVQVKQNRVWRSSLGSRKLFEEGQIQGNKSLEGTVKKSNQSTFATKAPEKSTKYSDQVLIIVFINIFPQF